MGVISILLGIIAIIAFTGAGAALGNAYIGATSHISNSFTALEGVANVSNTTVMIAFIGVFFFIGLLIGMTLIMLGINHNKLVKIQKRVRRL